MGAASAERDAGLPISLANKRFSVHGLLPAPRCVSDIGDIRSGLMSAVILHARVHRDKWCLTWT
jgi:hypothetical protein